MISITRSLLVLATAGAATVPMVLRTPAQRAVPTGELDPRNVYAKSQAEHYLTKEQYAFIRPGLQVTVEDVQIPADRHPVVELTIADDQGQPLDRAGIMTPGPVSLSYILSWYDAERRDYVAYTTRPQTSPITGDTAVQASSDSGGTTEDLEMGRIRYTFGTQLPADYDDVGHHHRRHLRHPEPQRHPPRDHPVRQRRVRLRARRRRGRRSVAGDVRLDLQQLPRAACLARRQPPRRQVVRDVPQQADAWIPTPATPST